MFKNLKNISKSRKKAIISISAVLFIGIMLSSILLTCANTQITDVGKKSSETNEEVETFGTDLPLTQSSEVRNPIDIDESSWNNWQWAKSVGICTGSGTENDPYVIKDYIIDGGNRDDCINIRNSNKDFIIKNCILYNSRFHLEQPEYAGISLYNTYNGKIINNYLTLNLAGIELVSCNGGGWDDINLINFNIIHGNKQGIVLRESSYNNILMNRISTYQIDAAIYGWYSNENTIAGNYINGNYIGIFLYHSNNIYFREWCLEGEILTIIWGNTIEHNYYGLFLLYSEVQDPSLNTFNNNNFDLYQYPL
ncbi:MAG: NosD domain-containing protein [Candidatus Hodarchaeota archaeon]